MKSGDFVAAVRRVAPAREQLEDYGLDDQEIDDILQSFRCESKESVAADAWQSELERLVTSFDCSRLEISQVTFVGEPEHREEGLVVAHWEADPIVVSGTGEVLSLDHADPSHSTPCGRDSERFLDAMLFLLEAVSRNKKQWKGRAADLADSCARLAGGETYRPFFGALTAFLS